MKTLRILSMLVAITLVFSACKNDTTSPTTGKCYVTGYVKDKDTKDALANVAVATSEYYDGDFSTVTDANGLYTLKIDVDSTAKATITMSLTGYRDTSFTVALTSGGTVTLSPYLTAKSGATGGTGLAQTIALASIDQSSLSVYGVGGTETAYLLWQVKDSLGNAIDADHAVTLTFGVTGPSGAYVSPVTEKTNSLGQATMTLNSGTVSGTCQITASATVNGKSLSSSPTRVTVYGGYPDQAHFTLSSPTYNFAALGTAEYTHGINVLIGDKYGNPATTSSVYFTTRAGVIEAGAVTSKDGEATTNLISGNPEPIGTGYAAAAYGDGYHYVIASTYGQGGTVVKDSILILWSGQPLITSVTPDSFNIANAGSQTFSFTVADIYGHPIAAGSTISVYATVPPPTYTDAKVNQVQVSFGTDGTFTMPDVLFPGSGSTQFTAVLKDGSADYDQSTAVYLTIKVTPVAPFSSVTKVVDGIVN